MALYRPDPYLAARQLAEETGANAVPPPPRERLLSPEEVAAVGEETANAQRSEVGKALNVGLENLRASGLAARGLARIPFNEQAGVADLQESQRIQQRAAELGPRVQNLDQVEGVGDAAEWAINQAAQQVPNIAAAAITGGVGSLAARSVAGSLARQVGTRLVTEEAAGLAEQSAARAAARAAAQRATAAGATAGGAAAGTVLEAGQIAPDAVLDPEGKGTIGERAAKAAVASLAAGSLEALPVGALFRKYGLTGAQEAVTGSLAARLAKQGLKQGAEEAATEVAQTAIERAGHKWVNDNVQVMGPDAYSDYLNAAAGGFLGGGAFGAPAGLRGAGKGSPAYGRVRERVGQIVDKITPNFNEPGQRAEPTGPVDDSPLGPGAPGGATVQAAKDFAADIARQGEAGIKSGVDAATAFFNQHFGQQSRENSVDAAVNEVFDDISGAEPLDYRTESGTTIFNRPFNQFADAARARASVSAGVPVDLAVVASTVPAEQEASLSKSGALKAASQALRGDALKTIDGAALRQYTEALTPDARRMFVRTAATMQELAAADQIQRDPSGKAVNAQIATPEAVTDTDAAQAGAADFDTTQNTTDEVALRNPADTYKALRGTPLRGQLSENAYAITDAKGRARQGDTRVLGSQLAQIKVDQDFIDSTRTMNARQRNVAALMQAASDVAQQGGSLDLNSLRTGQSLGRDWKLVPADIAAIRQAAAAQQFASRPRTGPVTREVAAAREATRQAGERDLINDPGAINPADIEQTAGSEGTSEADEQRVLAPRTGRPAELRVSRTGRVTEAQTQDTGTIDREARRRENTEQWGTPEKVARIDAGIKRVTGKAPTTSEERRAGIAAVRKQLTGEQLNTFNQRIADAATGRVADLTAARDSAREQWQAKRAEYAAAQKKGATPAALRKIEKAGKAARETMEQADTRLAAARTTANEARSQVKSEGRKVTKLAPKSTERVAKAQPATISAERDSDVTHADVSDAKSAEKAIKTRSRRSIGYLAMRIMNAKNLSQQDKLSLLGKLSDRRTALVNDISSTATKDVAREGYGSHSKAHFNNAINALNEATNVEDALKRVRQYATPAQRKIIDTLVQSGAVTRVPIDVGPGGGTRPGAVGGDHYSSPDKRSLNSKISIRYTAPTVDNTNRDPIRVLIHEAIHAATSNAELENPRVRRDLKKLLDHARAQGKLLGVDTSSWYGFSETQEFLAEALSNPEFQDLLDSMPAANTRSFKSLWQEFKSFVAQLLGFDNPSPTTLDEVFTVGLDAARITAEARWQALSNTLGIGGERDSFNGGVDSTPNSGSQPSDYMSMLPPRERLKLLAAFNRADVVRQIRAQLSPEQQAILDSTDEGPSLLVNTGLAMALNGQLNLTGAQSAASQLGDGIRSTLQIPSARTYANQIIRDLKAGKVNRQYDSRDQLLEPATAKATKFIQDKVAPVTQAFASDIDQRMRNSGVPALTKLATLMSQRTGEFRSDANTSFQARRNRERAQRLNDFFAITGKWTDEKKREVARALQTGDASVDGVKQVQQFFRDQYDYLTGAGLKLGKTENYFPVTIDGEKVGRDKQAFIDLLNEPGLKPHTDKAGGAEALWNAAINSTGHGEQRVADVTFADGAHDPSFKPLNERVSAYVYKNGTPEQIAKFAQFQDSNLDRIAVNYINRATSRAEWNRLDLGDQIKDLLARADSEGASPQQLRMAKDYVDQVMGVYGQDWHPLLKRAFAAADKVLGTKLSDADFQKYKGLQSALTTYQNVRLLPLALMSSLIDPLGSSVRSGGKLTQHFSAMKDAVRALRDKGGVDALRTMAEDMGVIERNAVNEALQYLYGGAHDPSGRLAKINNALFKYNGLELVTKFSRLTALSLGHRFLLDHASGSSPNSARYLKELGLTPADVKDDGTGHVVRSAKVDAALHRFVDESVIRPTPTQRPVWHNDPNFALASQYKGYLYSFWNTVMRRAGVELKNGNYRVLAPILLYLPITAFGEALRDAFQDDDKDRDMWDYAKLGVERSGLLGPKINILQSAYDDTKFGSSALNSVAGPTGQQLAQMYDTFAGERGLGKTAVEALPGSALYEDWGDGK